MKSKEFKPKETSPTPWRVMEKQIWHSVLDANGKHVCNCRNILDAKIIVEVVNKKSHEIPSTPHPSIRLCLPSSEVQPLG